MSEVLAIKSDSTIAWLQQRGQFINKTDAASLQSHCCSAVNWRRIECKHFAPRLMGVAAREKTLDPLQI
jgi:hypothetical protein